MTLSTPILTRPGGTGPYPSSQEKEGSSERVIAVQSHTAPNSQQRMGLQVFQTPAQVSAHRPTPHASRKTGARVPPGVAGPLGLPQPTLEGLPLDWGWDSGHLRGPGHVPPAGSQLSLHLPVSTSQDTRGAQVLGPEVGGDPGLGLGSLPGPPLLLVPESPAPSSRPEHPHPLGPCHPGDAGEVLPHQLTCRLAIPRPGSSLRHGPVPGRLSHRKDSLLGR